MSNIIKYGELLLDWSEVWGILIPLVTLLLFKKRQQTIITPIIIYLCLALLINLLADLIANFKINLPKVLESNNPIYNIHSIIRFTCFTLFFINIKKKPVSILKISVIIIMMVFIIINFLFYENFFNYYILSGSLLAVEAYLLLIFCMEYYLSELNDEVENLLSSKNFWIVTGLGIYVVINFFIFLFYVPMIKENQLLAAQMWNIHNVAYLIFCILIAKSFYAPISN